MLRRICYGTETPIVGCPTYALGAEACVTCGTAAKHVGMPDRTCSDAVWSNDGAARPIKVSRRTDRRCPRYDTQSRDHH